MKEWLNSWPGTVCALLLFGVIAPEIGMLTLVGLLLYGVYWLCCSTVEGAKATWREAHDAYQRSRREQEWADYLASTATKEQKPPTREELYAEILRRHDANCELIRKSPMDEATKAEALAEEKRTLEHRIKQLLE